jgi:Tfp pilus assembly protein PilF
MGGYFETALLAAERGRQAADQGDLLAAQREYETAVADDPDFVLAHLERARVLYDAGFVNPRP